MRDLAAGAHWALSGARGERAAGNGAAMRIAPLAFFMDPADARQRLVIRDVARITHHHEEAYVGALAVVIAVRAAACGHLLSAGALAAALPDSRVRDNLFRLSEHAHWTVHDVAREIGSSGFTPETIAVAVRVPQRMTENGIEVALYELNATGGDTDTIGSIAGQIAGANIGSNHLPRHILSGVPGAEDVERLAEQVAAIALAGLSSDLNRNS